MVIVSSGDRCGSEFIGTINVGAEPEERTEENRKEEQENEEDGRTPICIRVYVYIYMCGHTRRKGKIQEEHEGKVQVMNR